MIFITDLHAASLRSMFSFSFFLSDLIFSLLFWLLLALSVSCSLIIFFNDSSSGACCYSAPQLIHRPWYPHVISPLSCCIIIILIIHLIISCLTIKWTNITVFFPMWCFNNCGRRNKPEFVGNHTSSAPGGSDPNPKNNLTASFTTAICRAWLVLFHSLTLPLTRDYRNVFRRHRFFHSFASSAPRSIRCPQILRSSILSHVMRQQRLTR